MPALLEVPVQAAFAVVVICALIALTAMAVSRRVAFGEDRDGVFWYGFTGGFACLGAVTGAMVLIPGAAALIGLTGVLGIGVAAGWIWRGERERTERRRRQLVEETRAAVRARHESVLQRWLTYELDPAAAIDYPQMTDLKRPETAHLVRVMRKAAALRERTEPDVDGVPQEYEEAVGDLEVAFEAAERAAGAHSTGRGEDR